MNTHFPNLPARYRQLTASAGDAAPTEHITEGQAHAISIPATIITLALLGTFYWLSSDQLKRDRAERAKTRSNPRRRRR